MARCELCGSTGELMTLYVFWCSNPDCKNARPVLQHQAVQQQGHKSEGPDPDPCELRIHEMEITSNLASAFVERLVRRHGAVPVQQWIDSAVKKISDENREREKRERLSRIESLERTIAAGKQAQRQLDKLYEDEKNNAK